MVEKITIIDVIKVLEEFAWWFLKNQKTKRNSGIFLKVEPQMDCTLFNDSLERNSIIVTKWQKEMQKSI